MAEYHAELLKAAGRLLQRRTGQPGPLPSARIRRSISTSYYALFHFVLDEVGLRVAGTGTGLRRRRRLLARTISHRSIRLTFEKTKGALVHPSVADFVRPRDEQGDYALPVFARSLATVFVDAHARREEADYDLDKPVSEKDARALHRSILRAIGRWQTARSPADRDVKHALSLLIVLKGQLRAET